MVFETAVPITNFKKAADRIELEVLIETSLDENYELPEELVYAVPGTHLPEFDLI